jgi:uncharacterized membrane protein YozB (DUF420 family)
MRTASPWWLSLVLGFGLLLVLVGARLMDSSGVAMLGAVLVLSVTLVRGWTWAGSKGARRKVEGVLLLCHVGTLVGLCLYALTTKWGMSKLAFPEATALKFEGAVTVVYAVVLLASIVPVLMIEIALGQALRTHFQVDSSDEAGVEFYRVRDVGWSGLSIAFAASFLMVTCQVAKERNVQRDVSYFRTASPGESTKNIVKSTPDPIKVLLFFPAANEVKSQVRDYFNALASAAPGKIVVEEHDRFLDAELAGKYKVTKDGVIVLVRQKPVDEKDKDKAKDGKDLVADERSQTLEVDTDLEKARKGSGKLRNLDREVNSLLMKVVRDKRKAYVMTGHGEINDPDSIPPDLKGRVPDRRTTVFKKSLGLLNYEVKDLGLVDLASDVPDDATIVIMLAPVVALQPAEWEALDRYLNKGGRLLIALDPKADPSLGLLEGKLGVRYIPGDLTDDKAFLPQRGTLADRRFAFTTQFSAHASTTTLSRAADKSGLILIDSGALEEIPFAQGQTNPTRTFTIRSMDTSWLDYNNNFTFDPATEKRQRWNLAAAVEGPKVKDKDGKDKDGYRVLVIADTDLFTDIIVSQMGRTALTMISPYLLDDAVRWLGGEEQFVGEVVSEDDKPIKHTKAQDAKWFTVTVVGGPLVVLTLGLIGTWARRKRGKKTEVMS